jgi:hypothetical protein
LTQIETVSKEVFRQRSGEAIKAALQNTRKLTDSFIEVITQSLETKVSGVQIQQLQQRLRNDEAFLKAIRHQCGSIITKNLTTLSDDGIESACQALLGAKGVIKPITDLLHQHLSEIVGEDGLLTERIGGSVSGCNCFDAKAVSEIREIAAAVLKYHSQDVIGMILGRLRNDQKLNALLVNLEQASMSLADGDA